MECDDNTFRLPPHLGRYICITVSLHDSYGHALPEKRRREYTCDLLDGSKLVNYTHWRIDVVKEILSLTRTNMQDIQENTIVAKSHRKQQSERVTNLSTLVFGTTTATNNAATNTRTVGKVLLLPHRCSYYYTKNNTFVVSLGWNISRQQGGAWCINMAPK